jgi:5-methyltetrahydrofolate--homocysteine methyltransferase
VPVPPFWGARIAEGIALSDYLPHLDERALFTGRWALRAAIGDERTVPEILETEARPRLRALLATVRGRNLARARVAYGFFHAHSEGDDLVIVHDDATHRLTFPRQSRAPGLAIPDYFAASGDVIGLQVVTVGPAFTEAAAELYEQGRYRDYLELHGLGAQLAEALADYWHARMRRLLGVAGGQRYSFGYRACPDLAGRRVILDLLDAGRIGVALTETDLLVPEQSTDAMIVHHPAAIHFSAAPRPVGPDGGAGRTPSAVDVINSPGPTQGDP